jgi:uncharacterized protein (DUF362 family)
MHYNEYINMHYKELTEIINSGDASELQRWIWKFHNDVRQRKQQDLTFNIEELSSVYFTDVSKDVVKNHYRIVEDQMRKGMHMRMHTRQQMQSFMNILFELTWP